ncbi:hypothetical protein EUTSA_v10015661mg [Eutrema salsugineum]|uniref:MADS-box domain-containing protein n=1 Tax=Eutrema salsugineum TaxID=72664 RepID=V4NAK5_EUTSA|nr:agamous-like MADS-box protein AGL82 [Eutrema salsugineum]ESQ42876.1 hypothetical protein EUTSA_v10015661mg [Eutrema salsugineum]
MGRKMVKMARITNEKTRITTYRKRKLCLYKKAKEFSTLCGVKTCLIVYGPSRAGDEVVMEPELWPEKENEVREIISKYRETASSSCTKTYSVQECLEKSKITKVEKVKYCPWDKRVDKCSLSELYAVFVAVGNKIQEAANRTHHQTYSDSTPWSTDQLGLFGYNQQCFEQHQLFPMSTLEHNGFTLLPFLNQLTLNSGEVASFSTEQEMAAQAMFYASCSDGQYPPMVQRTAYLEPMQWGLGSGMFNNVKPFTDYPMRFGQVCDLESSGKSPM